MSKTVKSDSKASESKKEEIKKYEFYEVPATIFEPVVQYLGSRPSSETGNAFLVLKSLQKQEKEV